MTLHPTDEQAEIISATKGPSPLLIEAYAGTAKTTTLVMAAPQIRQPALALAFNRRIAAELRQRQLPSNWKISTLNGLGYGAWARAQSSTVKMDVDERKLGKLVTQTAKEQKIDISRENWQQIRDLVEAAMQAGLSPGDEGLPLIADTPEAWEGFASDLDIPSDSQFMLIMLAREVLIRSIALAKEGKISFDDQIYCPTILTPDRGWLKYPAVAVDEAQDLSPLNHRMLQLTSRSDGKIIAVGDSRQAIYAFRGADTQSIATLRGLREGWTSLSLTMTFRCPHRIVQRQQQHAPGFKAHHTVREGSFSFLSKRELEGWTFQKFVEASPSAESRAILCRNNAPLLRLAFALIRQRIGPTFAGRDLSKGLLTLAKKIIPEDANAATMRGKIADWELTERSRAISEGREDKSDSIEDKAASLLAVLEGAEASSRRELERGIEVIFQSEGSAVTLSSIHRAKGLEWDSVLHLDPWRLPSKQSKAAAARGDFGPMGQEKNLKYVAETRTRDTLIEANLEDFQGFV